MFDIIVSDDGTVQVMVKELRHFKVDVGVKLVPQIHGLGLWLALLCLSEDLILNTVITEVLLSDT